MALDFSRSVRSLQSDSFRPSLATLIVASLMLVAWFLWLVFASITLYETSTDWQVERDGSLIVHFPQETMARFHPGQTATLAVQPVPNQSAQQLPGIVADTPMRSQNRLAPDTVKVTLLSLPLPKGVTSGEVKIEVETVSPLKLITRAGSQFVQGP